MPNTKLTKEICMTPSSPIDVPFALIAPVRKHGGASDRAWIATLPS
jgi:hypothetical protein